MHSHIIYHVQFCSMFEHNCALGGAAINVDSYLVKLRNVNISNNRESALQVRFTK